MLPQSVRPLRASLEDLDDLIAHRAALIAEAKHLAQADDVRPQVLQEATKLAHGGSGDVKPEWFEGLFEKSLGKYDGIKQDMESEVARQDRLLDRIRVRSKIRLDLSSRADCRNKTLHSWQSEKMTLESKNVKVDYKRWTWRTGNGERLWITPKRVSNSTRPLEI